MKIQSGSLLLFRLFNIDVFVHWSWAIVAMLEIYRNSTTVHGSLAQRSIPYCIAQYLCLFLIVTIHEFGHALACKSTGGIADKIILWPLGGLAVVNPPPRPGAYLWSIVAGPLVNVILLPITIIPAVYLLRSTGAHNPAADFAFELALMNAILLAFNLLPVYPLDGGQILRGLLWFIIGRGRSLLVSGVLGIIGAAALAVAAILLTSSIWLGVTCIFLAAQSFRAITIGKQLLAMENALRHDEPACPHCKQNPPIGEFWKCPCGQKFDTFLTNAQCPASQRPFQSTACPFCAKSSPLANWYPPVTVTTTDGPPVFNYSK